jgi:hypothetical protein
MMVRCRQVLLLSRHPAHPGGDCLGRKHGSLTTRALAWLLPDVCLEKVRGTGRQQREYLIGITVGSARRGEPVGATSATRTEHRMGPCRTRCSIPPRYGAGNCSVRIGVRSSRNRSRTSGLSGGHVATTSAASSRSCRSSGVMTEAVIACSGPVEAVDDAQQQRHTLRLEGGESGGELHREQFPVSWDRRK